MNTSTITDIAWEGAQIAFRLIIRALSHAVGAYRALADLLATYGVELPGVARVLAAVGGAL